MKKFGSYNQFHEKSIPRIQDYLLPGEDSVTFRLKGIKYDEVAKDQKGVNQLQMPSCVTIGASFRVKDKTTGEAVDLLFIDSVTFDDKIILMRAQFKRQLGCLIQCRAGNVHDEDLFEYLMLCPDRDRVYELVDKAKYANEANDRRELRMKAMSTAYRMEEEELVEFALSMGWDHKGMGLTRNEVTQLAENKPQEFLDAHKDGNRKNRALIKQAFDLKIIYAEKHMGKYMFTKDGATIYEHPSAVAQNWLEVFNEFMAHNQKSAKIMEIIATRVQEKLAKSKKPISETEKT